VARSKTRRAPARVFGVLAEDATDCKTTAVLIGRIAPGALVRSRYGNGCANLRRKAFAWMRDLAADGCTDLLLIHDLDRDPFNGELNDEGELRRRLESIKGPRGVPRLVCIPVEEIEAWFWADPAVLTKVARRKVPEGKSEPHRVPRPKEELERLSRDERGRTRYDTNDNPALAKDLDPDLCAQRCKSFAALRAFVAPPTRPA
jgi:hypothetical protein